MEGAEDDLLATLELTPDGGAEVAPRVDFSAVERYEVQNRDESQERSCLTVPDRESMGCIL